MRLALQYLGLILLAVWLGSCSQGYTPKPRGYFRIDFPGKEYQLFDSLPFPYTFQYPVYGRVIMDDSKITEPFWVNVDFQAYKARIHISYKYALGRLDSLMEDSRTLAYKHSTRADAISERFYSNPNTRVYGILYQIKGSTASSWQFYVTDSSTHFLRGALYFSVKTNKDSLAPAIDFFGEDLIYLMETVEWKSIDK